MKDLYSPDNDLQVKDDGSGRLDILLVSGKDQIRQEIVTRLAMYRGEWFLDTRAGVPYHEHVLVKNPDMELIASDIRIQTMAVKGVTSVDTITLSMSGKSLTVSMKINGSITVQETIT